MGNPKKQHVTAGRSKRRIASARQWRRYRKAMARATEGDLVVAHNEPSKAKRTLRLRKAA